MKRNVVSMQAIFTANLVNCVRIPHCQLVGGRVSDFSASSCPLSFQRKTWPREFLWLVRPVSPTPSPEQTNQGKAEVLSMSP